MQAWTTFANGMPLHAMLPSGGIKEGLTNYVVPEGGEEGGPPGWTSRDLPATAFVDPHLNGRNFMIEPSKLTKDVMAKAAAASNVRASGTNLETRRERSHDALIHAAQSAGAIAMTGAPGSIIPIPGGMPGQIPGGPGPSQIPAVPNAVVAPRPAPAPQMPQAPMQALQQPTTLVQQHGQMPIMHPNPATPANGHVAMANGVPNMLPQPVQPQQGLFNRIQSGSQPPQVIEAGGNPIPAKKIQFEVQGVAFTMEAWFHDVIVQGNLLILAWNKLTVGYPKQFPPPASASTAMIAVAQEGEPLRVVQPPEIFLEFAGYELCVMKIVQTAQ